MISSTTNSHIICLCTCLVFCYCYSCSAKDNITTGEFINDDGLSYLESPGKKFQMGFFSPGEVRRYVGIWYTMDPKTVVWVANRAKPLLDSTGVLTVAENGKFVVKDKNSADYFSTPIGNLLPDGTLYRSLAGALQYLTFTRPDISYAVQQMLTGGLPGFPTLDIGLLCLYWGQFGFLVI
ncbi:putative non-specific serine/threonine protein kinase [Helianthus annuus]|nr:putative non-specific serine/threonine protein kinase [Helianthus annuus]